MSTQVVNPEILPVETELPATSTRDSREEKFLSLIFNGIPIREAARQAGYSEYYSISGIYAKFNSPEFQAKIKEWAISKNAQSVPKVCDLYGKAVDTLHEQVLSGNLDNLAKLKHIPRQILEIGKILSPEAGIHVNLVNIESLQAVIAGKVQTKKGSDIKGGE